MDQRSLITDRFASPRSTERIRELFGGQPTLILLDEISVYLRKVVRAFPDASKQFAAFIHDLFKAVASTPLVALAYTLAIRKDDGGPFTGCGGQWHPVARNGWQTEPMVPTSSFLTRRPNRQREHLDTETSSSSMKPTTRGAWRGNGTGQRSERLARSDAKPEAPMPVASEFSPVLSASCA